MTSNSGYEMFLAAVGSLLLWTDLYFIIHALNYRRSPEWNCRLVSALHAVIATSLCFVSAFLTGPWPFSYLGEANTSLHNVAMLISLGYFLFDFTWCLYMKTEGPVMLAHHVVSLVGLSYILCVGESGSELIAVMGASEVTNPLLQLRWFMKQSGTYSGMKSAVLDWSFAVMFVVVRLGVGSVFHYVCQTSPKVSLAVKAGGQAFYFISMVFGIQLILFVFRKYIQRRPAKRN